MVEYMEERCSVKTVAIIKNCNRGTLALANCELAIRSKVVNEVASISRDRIVTY